jgi:CheY-like chemotaxis protein
VPTLEAAVVRLGEKSADCLVVGPSVPDEELDARARDLGRDGGDQGLPVIVYGRAEAGPGLETAMSRLTRQVPLRMVAARERLLDQCALALHVSLPALHGRQRQILEDLHHSNAALAGRTVLVVDDDIRNIFALTSLLERYEMTVVSAETGRSAIELLEQSRAVEVVLMDVMMPEMDGFETMRAIRQNPRFRNLPIVAVTAKAMKGDRERCIEAGAWDYLAKPVDADELVALLRAWLVR